MPIIRKSPQLTVLDHPLIHHKLAGLRAADTPYYQFKVLLEDISMFLFYQASVGLETQEHRIKTPLEEMDAQTLDREILLVPILRAGLGMSSGILKIFPEALVGMLGMYRDPKTLQPVDYYLRLPEKIDNLAVFLLDPMLATGGSAIAAVDYLKKRGARNIIMLALISAPEGVEALSAAHPDIRIYTAALDRELNQKGYILPGLGDAGDRYFGL